MGLNSLHNQEPLNHTWSKMCGIIFNIFYINTEKNRNYQILGLRDTGGELGKKPGLARSGRLPRRPPSFDAFGFLLLLLGFLPFRDFCFLFWVFLLLIFCLDSQLFWSWKSSCNRLLPPHQSQRTVPHRRFICLRNTMRCTCQGLLYPHHHSLLEWHPREWPVFYKPARMEASIQITMFLSDPNNLFSTETYDP